MHLRYALKSEWPRALSDAIRVSILATGRHQGYIASILRRWPSPSSPRATAPAARAPRLLWTDSAVSRARPTRGTSAGAEQRRRLTLEGLADVDADRLIDDVAMQAWADSLGTDQELPIPQPD